MIEPTGSPWALIDGDLWKRLRDPETYDGWECQTLNSERHSEHVDTFRRTHDLPNTAPVTMRGPWQAITHKAGIVIVLKPATRMVKKQPDHPATVLVTWQQHPDVAPTPPQVFSRRPDTHMWVSPQKWLNTVTWDNIREGSATIREVELFTWAPS